MTACLPEIKNTKRPSRRTKSISFELGKTNGNKRTRTKLSGPQGTTASGNHGNQTTLRTTMSVRDSVYQQTNGAIFMGKATGEIFSASESNPHHPNPEYTEQTSEPLDSVMLKSNPVENTPEIRKLLRQKDEEISRLQELVRKMSFDREKAVTSHANSRLRIVELKNKLSGEHRKTEHVTAVERLRSKQKICSETEKLRNERDEARAQLTQHEKLVWQLRKQVDQLGYVCQQRHKVIQELNRKMAVKDKNLQELRKRMEQAQLIQICTTNPGERRNSVSSDTRHVAWETANRLTTVNEIPSINN